MPMLHDEAWYLAAVVRYAVESVAITDIMGLSIGQRLGPYEIRALLGTGGMGEVYEGHDTRLHRRVAIKTLRPELLADPRARRRFEREARAISSFSHPNICTVFDVGHQDGLDFLVMEYIEGRTLAALLQHESLNEATLVKYAAQIADAVAEAHDHGVLHRDIKPQNVMVTARGQAKVLDFGLAKDLEAQADALTVSDSGDAGRMIGTAAYMSPEQVRGESLDARSDAFSFGGLLYEAIAGQPPFQAPTVAGTLSAILTTEPVPLARLAPNTSSELQRIVRKCLEKDKSRRYQTLRDVSTDLENIRREPSDVARPVDSTAPPPIARHSKRTWVRLAGAAAALGIVTLSAVLGWSRNGSRTAPEIRSMAILPLKPLASGVSENYVGLGIADALISRLSGTADLMVRPTSAVRRYAGESSDALQAGGELRVDAVLDGTWQREADRLRVSINLLRVADGASLLTDRFDLPASDVFAIQDRVSEQVASRLRVELARGSSERPSRSTGGTANAEAYDRYLRGVFHLGARGYDAPQRQNTDTAIALFERAIALDPKYADAHAKLGFALAHTAIFMEDNPALIDRAKQETSTADALTPDLAQVHLNRAMILWSWYEGWRLVESIREYRRAEQLDPALNDMEVAAGYAHLGFFEDWRRVGARIIERDPTNLQARSTFVNERYLLNLPEEGRAEQKRLLNEGPDQRYFLLTRRIADAAPLVERNVSRDPEDFGAQANLALLRALQGRHSEARSAVQRVVQLTRRTTRYYHHVTYTLARVAALRGDADEAARWLEETIAWGFPCYPMFSTDAFLDPVRQSPRVQKVLADLKVDWERYRDALR
jgi:eukaryotic-like serine/threonine-protein kinase